MESLIVNNQKRKKRKTRKNLDAIRKKALQTLSNTNFDKDCNPVISSNIKFLPQKSSICITSKRLTLFRKAIRSDTVSRTMISEVNNKTHNKENKNSNIEILEIQAHPQKEPDTNIFTTNSDNHSVNCISYDNKNNIEKDMDKTPSSVILFSPSLQIGDSDTSDKLGINSHQSDHVLFNISSENNLHSENKFYNNFMNEIPNYLQKTAPILLKTDIVDKWNNSLRNLYIKDEHFENEASSASNYGSSWSDPDCDSIIENPIDYLGYSYQEISKPNSVSSPIVSMASNSAIGQSSSPESLTICDSPDYTYYPHRLNQ